MATSENRFTVEVIWVPGQIHAYTVQMAKKLYVGNLSFRTTETDLSDMFGEIGQVESVQIITDRDTGRSKGFAFVQMTDDAAAEKAIDQLNGKEVGGRNLTVNEAREKRDFGGRGGGGSSRRY
jgi:RNA recognition motif-containing protein